jgi:hypothetical protein
MKVNWPAVIAALNLMLGAVSHGGDLAVGANEGGKVQSSENSGDRLEPVERPKVEAFWWAWTPQHSRNRPERPEKPEHRGRNAEMKETFSKFNAKLADLQAQQKDIAKQWSDANREERRKLRDELKVNRETYNKLKDQFHDDVAELHDSLKNHDRKVDREAQAEAKSKARAAKSRN